MSQTRDRLLDAALEIFSEKGFQAATIREIADRAGVRNITVFRHFGNKENLLTEIQNRRPVAPMAVDLLDKASDHPVDEVLHELGRRYYSQLLSREKMIRFLLIESGQDPGRLHQVSGVPQAIQVKLTEYLGEKMAQGAIRKGDPAMYALAFTAMFFSAVVGKGFMPSEAGRDPDETARAFVDVFLKGVMTPRQ